MAVLQGQGAGDTGRYFGAMPLGWRALDRRVAGIAANGRREVGNGQWLN